MILTAHRGKYAHMPMLIDDADYDLVKDHRWYVVKRETKNRRRYYGETCVNGKHIHLHRLILGYPDDDVDHINHDGLDCRRENMRVTTRSQNLMNQRSHGLYKGVTFDKSRDSWKAQIKFQDTNYFLGRFTTQEEAALAYNKKASELFGEFASLNEVKHDA